MSDWISAAESEDRVEALAAEGGVIQQTAESVAMRALRDERFVG